MGKARNNFFSYQYIYSEFLIYLTTFVKFYIIIVYRTQNKNKIILTKMNWFILYIAAY